MAFCSLKHTPAFSDSTINNKTEKSSLVQSLVSKICPEWTIIPRESIEDLWQCHHCSSVQFSSTGETSSQRSSPTPSSVTQVCLQVQQQANAKLAFVFRWFLFVDDLEVTTSWWHTLSTNALVASLIFTEPYEYESRQKSVPAQFLLRSLLCYRSQRLFSLISGTRCHWV